MNVAEAQKLRDNVISEECQAMKAYMLPIYERIRGAAMKGESSITDQCFPKTTSHVQDVVALNILKKDGYTVQANHSGQYGEAYTTISW